MRHDGAARPGGAPFSRIAHSGKNLTIKNQRKNKTLKKNTVLAWALLYL
ncbi:hypothetical protein [Cronobacter condimenti]|nr:hypothetical protein [Cronobacter condimenti]